MIRIIGKIDINKYWTNTETNFQHKIKKIIKFSFEKHLNEW